MPYTLSSDADRRPVAVLGAGTLGSRIALMFAAGIREGLETLERSLAIAA